MKERRRKKRGGQFFFSCGKKRRRRPKKVLKVEGGGPSARRCQPRGKGDCGKIEEDEGKGKEEGVIFGRKEEEEEKGRTGRRINGIFSLGNYLAFHFY